MTQSIMKGLLAALFILGALNAQAEGKTELTLRTVPNLSTQVRDGQRIGGGEIRTQEAHSGYQVRLDAPLLGDAPNRYVILGGNNPQHKLRVMLGQDGWTPNKKTMNGIIKQTSEAQTYFDIVADGNQIVPADEYSLTVQGCYLEP